MSVETQELLNICEQLPQAKRAELTDFARLLLAKDENTHSGETQRWLTIAQGAAKMSMSTDELMKITRGEA